MEGLDLDESPIQIDSGEASLKAASESEEEQEYCDDADVFKGSFLQEMERLTRPVIYEKHRESIYEEDETNNQFIFAQSQEPQFYFLDFKAQEILQTPSVIDFTTTSEQCCSCICHSRNNLIPQKKKKESIAVAPIEKYESDKVIVPKKWETRSRDSQKTSVSLKDYKQYIKKKLQDKK